jgi:type II secretory pathway pseudopilin PulG
MKDKHISNIFAECLEAIEKKELSVEECLNRYPDYQDELRELLTTCQIIQDTPVISPRLTYRQVAKTRLENLLPDHPKPVTFLRSIRRNKRNGNQSYQRRFSMNWLIIVALAASLFAGGTGVAYASEDALPGEALYGVKNAVQNVQLALSSDESDVDLLLGFMGEHIEEIEALTEMGQFQWISQALDGYDQDLGLLIQTRNRISYEDAHAEDAITSRIQAEVHAQLENLQQIQTRLSEQQQFHQQLQQTIRAAENAAGYGPAEGGPPAETGSPYGAGEGEPQGEQQQYQNQTNKPEDAGGPNQDAGSPNQDPGTDGPRIGGKCDSSEQEEGGEWQCVDGFWQYNHGQGGSGNGQGQGGKP